MALNNYRETKIVSSGEWVTFPEGQFQYGAKPRLYLGILHPMLSDKTLAVLSKEELEQWDGKKIKFSPVKASLWQREEAKAHFRHITDDYLTYFPRQGHRRFFNMLSF